MSDLLRVLPGPRSGLVTIPASKSRAHRLLICAALSRTPCEILCSGISRDIQATVDCLRGMGADLSLRGDVIRVSPIPRPAAPTAEGPVALPCGESGSTLRFLLPVAGALGLSAVFLMEGRLPERPMQPLTGVLEAHGMKIRQDGARLYCEGQLSPGAFSIPGNISSQYISGLLFALPLLPGDSTLEITGPVESADYIRMTEDALTLAGFRLAREGHSYAIPGNQTGLIPARLTVESDWSSAAFFLCLGALSPAGLTVRGMNPASSQGDRAILELLAAFGAKADIRGEDITLRAGDLRGVDIDASAIPDLVPVLSVVAAAARGETVIRRAERLRLKESDRLATTAAMLTVLGGRVTETPDGLIIRGAPSGLLTGGTVDSFLDHRIAMSAAVAASVCARPVEVLHPSCTDKSFPGFWPLLEGLDREEPRARQD